MDAERPLRVVIVEDHVMVAEGLAAGLSAEADLSVLAVAGGVTEGVAAVEEHRPDVVVMDYRLPDGTGADATLAIREISPETSVLVITGERTDDVAAAVVESGCAGLLAKAGNIEEVVQAIRAVHAGETVFDSHALAAALRSARSASSSPHERYELTVRELEVLRLLHTGASTGQIAEALTLSVHTVRNHVRNLIAKLGAHSRLEALAIARQRGLVDDASSGG